MNIHPKTKKLVCVYLLCRERPMFWKHIPPVERDMIPRQGVYVVLRKDVYEKEHHLPSVVSGDNSPIYYPSTFRPVNTVPVLFRGDRSNPIPTFIPYHPRESRETTTDRRTKSGFEFSLGGSVTMQRKCHLV